MKQFRCADIVPGCAAEVRARRADEVVANALAHLTGAHGLEDSPALEARVRAGVRSAGILAGVLSVSRGTRA